MTEIEGQLDLLDLIPTLEEQHPTPPRLTTSTARGYAARVAAFAAWEQRYGHFGSLRISHGWHASFTGPEGPVTRCQATLLTADFGCAHYGGYGCHCVGGIYYRGACLHCAWEGPVRTGENQAVADGLDHAHPGWRTSPTVPSLPHDASPKRRRRWQETVDGLYGDRPEGHPIITERTAPATRAVPDRSPWGGYDVAACTVDRGAETTQT